MPKWLRYSGLALIVLTALFWGTVHFVRLSTASHCSAGDLPASVLDFFARALAAGQRGESSITFDVPDVVLVVPAPYCDNSDPLITSLGLRHACEDVLVSKANVNDTPIIAAVSGDELLGSRFINRFPGIDIELWYKTLRRGDILKIEVAGEGDSKTVRLTFDGE